MVGWHQELNGQGFEPTPGDSLGQRSLADYSSWGRKESDKAEQLSTAQHRIRSGEGGDRG